MKTRFVGCLCAGILAGLTFGTFFNRTPHTPGPATQSDDSPNLIRTASNISKVPTPNATPGIETTNAGLASGTKQYSQSIAVDPGPVSLEKTSLEQVLQSLQSVADGSLEETAQPLGYLQAWLRAHPDDGASSVLQSLQTCSTNQWNLSKLLIQALTEDDPVLGNQALLSLLTYAGSYPPMVTLQATIAAGKLGTSVDPMLKQVLFGLIDWQSSESLRGLSDAALFSFARLAGRDSDSFGVLAQRLNPWLETSANPAETIKALTILTQAGINGPDFVRRASDFSKSSDESIRSAAEEYLSSLPWGGSADTD